MKRGSSRVSYPWGATSRLWALLFVAICALPVASHAFERDITLRFLLSSTPDVTGYVVYATNETTQAESVLDVDFVEPGPDGIAHTIVALDATKQ